VSKFSCSLKRFPLMNSLQTMQHVQSSPAHWFAHLHIMLRAASFVKMALRINNLCALRANISTWIALIMAFFSCNLVDCITNAANNRLEKRRSFLRQIPLFHKKACAPVDLKLSLMITTGRNLIKVFFF
jgi:hypothetical protein